MEVKIQTIQSEKDSEIKEQLQKQKDTLAQEFLTEKTEAENKKNQTVEEITKTLQEQKD